MYAAASIVGRGGQPKCRLSNVSIVRGACRRVGLLVRVALFEAGRPLLLHCGMRAAAKVRVVTVALALATAHGLVVVYLKRI